jgi:hypothetical protein
MLDYFSAINGKNLSSGAAVTSTTTTNDDATIDVICIDNEMNKMHGLEATRCIRSMGFKGCIIAVTGSTSQEDIDAFTSAGTDYFLEKPLNLQVLREILVAILKNKY